MGPQEFPLADPVLSCSWGDQRSRRRNRKWSRGRFMLWRFWSEPQHAILFPSQRFAAMKRNIFRHYCRHNHISIASNCPDPLVWRSSTSFNVPLLGWDQNVCWSNTLQRLQPKVSTFQWNLLSDKHPISRMTQVRISRHRTLSFRMLRPSCWFALWWYPHLPAEPSWPFQALALPAFYRCGRVPFGSCHPGNHAQL